MKLTACNLLFLSVVTLELVTSHVSTVTTSPNYTEEVPSTHMPHILSNATLISVVEGQNVTFQCSVDELGEFVIIWMKNTEVYFAGTHALKKDPRFTLREDKSIHIANVHTSDAANYVCQISTTPPLELHHTLVVKVAPKAKTIPPNGLYIVNLGDPIDIGCIASGVPPPVITWTHSMKEVTEYVKGGEISIPEAKKEDAGIYECKVDNGFDIPALGKIEVNVHYKPHIEVQRKLIYTGEGASAEIQCSVFGEPTPKVTWLKNNERIHFPQDHLKTDSLRHSDSGHTHRLVIRRIMRHDLGIYTCKAANSLGSAHEMIEITGVPAPVEFKNGVDDNKPNSYSIKWSVKSHSPINEFKLKFRKRQGNGDDEEYEWTEVAIPAEKQPGLVKTHTYDITGLEPATVYEAVILTRNKYGWNNRSEIFIFTTEGGIIGGDEDIEAVLETNEPNENMVKTNEVTSSSIAETRTNAGDGAESISWTAHFVTAMYITVMLLW